MNLTLLQQSGGQWVYRSPEQMELARLCLNLLHWDLHAFDCWVFDDNNWSMYTRQRQRLIALRGDLSIAHAQLGDDCGALERLLCTHCINVYKTTRSSKVADHPVLEALVCAYPVAKHKVRACAPTVAPPRRDDERTVQLLRRQLSGYCAEPNGKTHHKQGVVHGL
jgi:hypothetical protein